MLAESWIDLYRRVLQFRRLVEQSAGDAAERAEGLRLHGEFSACLRCHLLAGGAATEAGLARLEIEAEVEHENRQALVSSGGALWSGFNADAEENRESSRLRRFDP